MLIKPSYIQYLIYCNISVYIALFILISMTNIFLTVTTENQSDKGFFSCKTKTKYYGRIYYKGLYKNHFRETLLIIDIKTDPSPNNSVDWF